ncbi:uncharacterized protein TNCV_1160101 [Trichonephila clavipes]|nr:uncharacterized protein TNCV_1160101 [Trichonephila clavipes]
MCKADVRKGLEDGLAMRLPLSEPREIYKDKLETDNRSNIGSEFNFEIDLPGKRDRSTIYRLNLIKLYHRKPELANLVMENSSEGIDSEILYSCCVKGILGTGGVMDKCVQMLDKELWRLGPDGSGVFWRVMRKWDEEGEKGENGKDGGERGERRGKKNGEETEKEREIDGKRVGEKERSPPCMEKRAESEIGVERR